MRDRGQIFAAGSAGCLLLAFAYAGGAIAAPGKSSRCRPSGSHSLLSRATYRVYRTRASGRGEAKTDRIVACWLASEHRTTLLDESPLDVNNVVEMTALKAAPGSASVIGISSSIVGAGSPETDLLQAVNVRTGHTINSNQASAECPGECQVNVFEFVLTRNGTLALLGQVLTGERCAGLYTIPVGGPEHLLECGLPPPEPQEGAPTISGLAYANGVLSWKSNGAPKSAPLN
jgi:hypothetical protein